MVDSRTPTFLDSGIGNWGTYASPAGHAGITGVVYCLVGTGISSGSITDVTKYRVRRCEILTFIKSGLSCLFAYQFRQSIVWTMELAINEIGRGW